MIYSTERVLTLSKIAHIALSQEETEAMRHSLGKLHGFAEALQNAPIEAEAEDPFLDAVGLEALREDCVEMRISPKELCAGTAETGYFTVPRTVEE